MATARAHITVLRKAGFSLQNVADQIGVSLMTAWRWENDPPQRFDLAKLKKLEKMAQRAGKKSVKRRKVL